jgi:hypothetical protein
MKLGRFTRVDERNHRHLNKWSVCQRRNVLIGGNVRMRRPATEQSKLPQITPQKRRPRSELSESRRFHSPSPFRIPDDVELFAIRDRGRAVKDKEWAAMQTTPYHMHGFPVPRENFRHLTKIEPPRNSAEEEALAQLILSPEANEASEGLRDFIDQKREIFLAQLAIDTKRQELERLERLEREESEHLANKDAEVTLFQRQFHAFLDADSTSLTEARRAAENKAKQRLEVSLRIRQVSAQISSLRSDIAHHEEKFQECEGYKEFIEGITPPEWRATHPLPELYFKTPEQLLDIMQTLESQNMFLIRHCQEAEELVERCKGRFNDLLEERDVTINDMTNRKNASRQHLDAKNAHNDQYRMTGDFRFGTEFGEAELVELTRAVMALHAQLGFAAASTGETVAVLRRIEGRMDQLFGSLARQNQNVVKELYIEKAHHRRDMERAAKAAQKQKEQEEKTQRALALATMPIKRRTGRPLFPRTLPMKKQSREKLEEQMRIQAKQLESDQDLLFGPIWE